MGIEVNQLSFNYGRQPILDNISFYLEKGQVLVVYGPSGSGKSTLLRLLAGFERPLSGTISIHGDCVANDSAMVAPDKRNCAMIFQQLALWPHMTVTEHLAFGRHQRQDSKDRLNKKVSETLQLLELSGKKYCYPDELSGGEQQRLAIGRALMAAPRFLLLDEPLSNLDTLLQQKIIDLLLMLKRKKNLSMIYVSHNFAEVIQLADKVIALEHGKQIFYDSKAEFIKKYYNSIQQSISWFTRLERKNDG